MKTVIMAGGRGTRISELFPDIPKPLIPIEGVPVLEREIVSLRNQGFKDIIMTVSHMGDKIMNHFGDGSKLEVSIQYYNEVIPLGNAGALFKLREQLGNESFLLLNADAVFDVDFNRMVRFHQKHGGLVTLFTHPNNHPYDSGLIIGEADMSVQSWLAKEDVRPIYYKNRVNAGLHVIDGENDVKAGLAAGCKTVLINGEGTDAKNEDFGQIDTLSSVLEFVDKYLH